MWIVADLRDVFTVARERRTLLSKCFCAVCSLIAGKC